MSRRLIVSEDRPISTTRPVVDTGGSITGGLAQVGIVGITAAMRSATSCRASRTSVSSWKKSSICDSCGTDFERIVSSSGIPFSDCSSGIVTSDSTSAADRPIAEVWISTRGGANSGKTSTGIARSCCTPKNIIAAALATTMYRNRRLAWTIQRSMVAPSRYSSPTSYSVPSSSAAPTMTTSVPGGGPLDRSACSPSIRITSIGARTNTSGSGLV